MPLNLTHCTLTGVDELTSLADVYALSVAFPMVEWGFLYSPKRQGQPGRYPSIMMLADAFQSLPKNVRVAMHVCGDGVHNLLAGQTNETKLLDLVVARKGRIQLNFNQVRKPIELNALVELLKLYPETTFITQDNNANVRVWQFIADLGIRNHAVLFDGSAGQGIPCSEWPQPLPISCGYAGGLGPDNIVVELDRIAEIAGNRPTWIDMEGKLRRVDANGADWLNLDACRACLEAVQAHMTVDGTLHQSVRATSVQPAAAATGMFPLRLHAFADEPD